MTTPHAILFDLGGTVLRQRSFRPEAWASALVALAPDLANRPLPDLERQVRQLVSEFRRHSKAGLIEVRIDACLRHLHDRLGLDLPQTPAQVELAFWQAVSRMTAEPGIGPLLARLTASGLPVGLVSNSMFSAAVLRWELAGHGLDGYFPLVLSSADYGLRKPHPSLFHTAVARLHLTPREVWFVGDDFTNDVLGAARAGLAPVWYNRPVAPLPPEAEPVAQVRHWDDFLPLLDGAE
jgi:putative hydrolase of the HAD superfamily